MGEKLKIMVHPRLYSMPQGAPWLQVVYVSPTIIHLPLDNCASKTRRS